MRASLVWVTILVTVLGILAILYWYMMVTGRCIAVLLVEDCTKPSRSRMEVIFIVLACIAGVAAGILAKIALGFPHERYAVTAHEIVVTTGWPLRSRRSQALVHASVRREGETLLFTGVGEKPVRFGPLRPGDAERIQGLVNQLKTNAAATDDQA